MNGCDFGIIAVRWCIRADKRPGGVEIKCKGSYGFLRVKNGITVKGEEGNGSGGRQER